VNILDMETVGRDIQRAVEISDFAVILSHMGEEYSGEPSESVKSRVRHMLECGADAVVACHPHIVQPIESIGITDGETLGKRKCLAAYSLGNFLSSQNNPPVLSEGGILDVYICKDPGKRAFIKEISFTKTVVEGAGYTIWAPFGPHFLP
jgi:poly-gamma-glutamate synthesis protein (capsule biosynthesis protein)